MPLKISDYTIYIYICVYECAHVFVLYVCVCAYMYVHLRTFMCVYICVYVCKCVGTLLKGRLLFYAQFAFVFFSTVVDHLNTSSKREIL